MKRNWLMRIGAAALVVGVMSMSMIGGTLAKYASTVSSTGQVQVAKWDVSFKKDSKEYADTVAFDLTDTAIDSKLKDTNLIAPGSKGSFTLEINPGSTEVGIDYQIKLDVKQNLPITFKVDNDELPADGIYKDKIAKDTTAAITKTVSWEWADGDATTDNTYGENTALTTTKVDAVTVTLTAEQTVETTPAPAP